MTPFRRLRRALPAATSLLLAAAALAGCAGIPDRGPVTEVTSRADAGGDRPVEIVAAPPQPGESATDIVLHFLDAMMASPVRTSVAREFLTEDAATRWDPQQATIIYAEPAGPPTGTSTINVTLSGASRLDSRGAWQGELSPEDSVLSFPVVQEKGEWRIARAPNALVVQDSWFEQRFRQVSLYFFDSRARVLVPEPVYVPSGDQLSTSLVAGLVRGPGPGLEDVERTFLPEGVSAGLVPVSASGVAKIALGGGDPSQLTPETTERMLTQLAWTMRQDPRIRSLQVSLGRTPLTHSGSAEIPLNIGADYDPTGILASAQPFALRDGRLVGGPLDAMDPVDGPPGSERLGWRSFAVDLTSRRAAGVSADGTAVSIARLQAGSGSVREVASQASDLLPPVWDLAGVLWLVDRRGSGAVVTAVVQNRPLQITVPGVSGQRVRSFLVSRDGSRFVAVLRGPTADAIVVSRIRRDEQGGLLGATRARRLTWPDDDRRIVDIGWRSPTSVATLSRLSDELAEVRTLSVDGSPGFALAPATTTRGRIRWLVSSPVTAEHAYAVAGNGLIVDLAGPTPLAAPEGLELSTLTYAG